MVVAKSTGIRRTVCTLLSDDGFGRIAADGAGSVRGRASARSTWGDVVRAAGRVQRPS